MLVTVLPCTITKQIRRRILVDKETLEHVFQDVLELHAESVEAAAQNEKNYISDRPPSLKISYRDGTEYVLHDLVTFQNVIPGRGRSIKSIEISSRFGSPTCSIELHAYGWRDYANLIVAGLEDKASHFADDVISKLSRESDITVFARKVWPMGWGLVFASAFLLPFAVSKIKDAKDASATAILVLMVAFPLGILVELFRNRWMPTVAFLWGEDGRRAKQAKAIVTTAIITIPLGLLINLASTAISGR